MAIFQRMAPRNRFAGAQEQILGGINQKFDESAIERALSQINKQGADPLTALLGSGASPERQGQAIAAFQNQQKLAADKGKELQKTGDFLKSSKAAGDIFKRVDAGELSIDQGVGEIFESVEDPKIMSEAIADLKSRRMDLRVRDRLEKSDFEVKENVKMINDITAEARQAKNIIKGIDKQRELINTGKTSDFKQFIGKEFPTFRRFLENPESTENRALALNDMKGAVSLFGGGARFTDAKLRFIMDTLANPGATKEQQLAALNGFEEIMRSKLVAEQALRRIREQNPGKNLKFIPGLSLKMNDFLDEIDDEEQPSLGVQPDARGQSLDQILGF